jgi:hypothetical protein
MTATCLTSHCLSNLGDLIGSTVSAHFPFEMNNQLVNYRNELKVYHRRFPRLAIAITPFPTDILLRYLYKSIHARISPIPAPIVFLAWSIECPPPRPQTLERTLHRYSSRAGSSIAMHHGDKTMTEYRSKNRVPQECRVHLLARRTSP